MDYPLIVGGVELGRLNVEQQGLFTVFEAQCQSREGLLRISVYGSGKEGYLGLMQPWNGGLYIKKKLSRAQMAAFPEAIEYAAPSGDITAARHVIPEEPIISSPQPTVEELTWFRRADGSLVSHDGKSCIVALPTVLSPDAVRVVIREIDGQKYMLFRY